MRSSASQTLATKIRKGVEALPIAGKCSLDFCEVIVLPKFPNDSIKKEKQSCSKAIPHIGIQMKHWMAAIQLLASAKNNFEKKDASNFFFKIMKLCLKAWKPTSVLLSEICILRAFEGALDASNPTVTWNNLEGRKKIKEQDNLFHV